MAAAASFSSSPAAPVPAIASASSTNHSTATKDLKDALLFNGADTGTDSDRDDDRTSKTGRERERERERDRERDRRRRDNNTPTLGSKPRVDRLDKENGLTTSTASMASSSAKRKPPSSSPSASIVASATTSSAQPKPKQAAKLQQQQQQQRAAHEAESPEGEVYCVCRLPNTGEAMICCEECDEWYHFRCIGMTAAEAARTEHYVCASCKKIEANKRSAGAKDVDGKKRRRDEDAGKATGARVNGLDGELEGKRTRRQRNGVEERDEDMGDGTGKWLKKDMVVDSESDEEEWVYMTSEDEGQPQQPTIAVKFEQIPVKQEDAIAPVAHSTSLTSTSLSSAAAHRLPRVSSPAVSFDRPDYRLHPLIHQTAPRAPRQPRSSSPTRVLVGSLAIECATAVRSVIQHRWLAALQEPERQCEGHIPRQVNRCVQRWQTVLEEYEWEETKRQMQLSAEEWRWRRLINHYLNHELDTAPQSDNGIRPPPTSFELLLSSALPIGLGHPRFVHDTQEVVNAAHEKSIQTEALNSLQSQQTTPSSYAATAALPSTTSISTTSSSTSRLTFHFHRVKRDPADFVGLETLWCVGCAGYVPVDEYGVHVRDCCETAITTPDQKLVVVMPYEQPIPEPLAVELDAPAELEKLVVLGEVEDAETRGKREEKQGVTDKADAARWELGDKPDAAVLAMGRFHQQLANRRALSLQFDARQHSSDPAGRFPLREYLNKPSPEPKPAESVAAQAASRAGSSQLPQPRLSMAPAPHLITRYQRFLNPVLFPHLLCGYPLLSASTPSPLHFCAHLHSTCSEHCGWEERWDMERRAARVRLEGRLRAVKADTEGMRRVLDVEEKERLAGRASINNQTQAVTSALSVYLEVDRAEAANEASPAPSELSDGSGQDMEEMAIEAHTLQRRPGLHGPDSSEEGSSEAEDAVEANGIAAPGGEKKRTDRERLRERERINKQRQRERAKAREREKEIRMREKERSREKKREKRKRKEKERERKERRRDKDRHAHSSKKKKSSSRSGVRRRDESSSSEHSSNSSDDRSDDSRTSLSSDARDY